MYAWNRGMKGEEYKRHFKNGFGGIFKKGQIPHNKGIPQSEWMSKEGHERWSEAIRKTHPEKNFGKYAKKGTPSINKGKPMSQKQRESLRPYWESLKGRKMPRELVRRCLRPRKMSLLEKRFDGICKEHNIPYKFVGNGKFFVDNLCPDFINCNGQKIAVEVYYRRHKEMFRGGIDDWKKERSRVFNKYGWKLVFFDERRVNEENILKIGGGD